VSGAAALIFAKYPSLGAAGVKDAILNGAEHKSSFAGKTVTGGRLNARMALDAASKLAPKLTLSGPTRQRAVGKGSIVVYARCTQTCALVASGGLSISGSARGIGLKKVARSAAGGKRKKLVLKLPRRAQATAKRALARHRRVFAKVSVIATDRDGYSIRGRRKVRLN